MRPRLKDQHFTDDIFKYISLNENFQILNKISLKYVPLGLIDNMTALVQIMAFWALNRWQAVIWNNVGMFSWCIYASLSLNKLDWSRLLHCNYVTKHQH